MPSSAHFASASRDGGWECAPLTTVSSCTLDGGVMWWKFSRNREGMVDMLAELSGP